MHEIVHLSTGPWANTLETVFYNSQSDYFVYTDEAAGKSYVNPAIHFMAGKEYNPRAVLWDFRNGFGTLKKYSSVYEDPVSYKDLALEQGDQKVEPLEIADASAAPQCWTEKLKVPVHPRSQQTILSWEADASAPFKGKLRGSDSLIQFDEYEQGVEEFKLLDAQNDGEYLEGVLRPMLERCDHIECIDLNTEMSGWAGLSGCILESLRDNYVPKLPIISWCSLISPFSSGKARKISFLRTVLTHTEHSTLFVPLHIASTVSESLYTIAALYETFGVMASLRKNRFQVPELISNLATEGKANMLSPVLICKNQKKHSMTLCRRETLKVRRSIDISRHTNVATEGGIVETPNPDNVSESEVQRQYICPEPLPTTEYEPAFLTGLGDAFTARLQVDDSPLELRKLAAATNDHNIREQVYDMTESYIWGYDPESEDEDDS